MEHLRDEAKIGKILEDLDVPTDQQFTLLGFLCGILGIYVGFLLMMLRWFAMCGPLLGVYLIVFWGFRVIGITSEVAMDITLVIGSIPALALLIEGSTFIFPVYFDILNRVGFFLQRAHTFDAGQARAIVSARWEKRLRIIRKRRAKSDD